MPPVISARFGGLFCACWTPEGGAVVYKSEGFWPVLSLERMRHGDSGRYVVEFHAGTLAIFADAKIRVGAYALTPLRNYAIT